MADLTMGPLLFHWPAEEMRDFWFRIADEAPVDTAYLGETVCSKRTPFFEPYFGEVAERLKRGGKNVVWSTLSEVMIKRDRNIVAGFCDMEDTEIEANDASALFHLSGRPHRIGQAVNVYNEATLAFLASKGATDVCLPVELPAPSIAAIAEEAAKHGTGIEVQVFGRVSLALSARCYHARAHGRTKDNCQFVCENDPDGMDLNTRSNMPFLAINGIQTMSHRFLNLAHEMAALEEMGVTAFRLSPHTRDMVAVAACYRDLLNGEIDAVEATSALDALGVQQPMMNGFVHGEPGFRNVQAGLAARAAR
jgi:collagenase-like PrtC family protease